MVDRPQFALEVVEVDRGTVVLEGRVPKLVPQFVAETRARTRAITVTGVVDPGSEAVRDLLDGDLSGMTDVVDFEVLSEDAGTKEVRIVVEVNKS